jgi:predicted Zn-dependent protease
MVSVQRDADGFAMSFERSFLATLGEDELEAVVAHELGHVWIFTHHPYLHTEALANQVAMRVVSRGSLEAVYEKVRARGGLKGHLVRFDGTP